jgi:hypothetical protein
LSQFFWNFQMSFSDFSKDGLHGARAPFEVSALKRDKQTMCWRIRCGPLLEERTCSGVLENLRSFFFCSFELSPLWTNILLRGLNI